jgi:DNA repair photolyase
MSALTALVDRALSGADERQTFLGQFIKRRVPIHFGGMSDPFQPVERKYGVTREYLEVLTRYQYPTIISTRGAMVSEDEYIGLLKELKNVIVQFSFSTTRDKAAATIEPHSTPPSRLLKAMEELSTHGVAVTCRWQPYIVGFSEQPREFLDRVSEVGCKHVALEHLKVPLERRGPLWKVLRRGLGSDPLQEYREAGARRDGRELVLQGVDKLRRVLHVRASVISRNMTFGAADNELQYLSSTGCCCSGADQFAGFENWFSHQIGAAVRACTGRQITYGVVSRKWAPVGSIDRYLNSHSRLKPREQVVGTLQAHIKWRWNHDRADGNPTAFYGVIRTDKWTRAGYRIYDWDPRVLELLPSDADYTDAQL